MRASSVRVLAAGLAVMQAGTLVGQAPMSAYAAELEDLSTEEVENGEEESGETEDTSKAEGSAEVEESSEVEEASEEEESSEVEESVEAEETSESEEPAETEEPSEAEEPTELEDTSEVEESAEETSEAEEPTEEEETSEAEESSESEESTEADETLENDLAAPEKTESPADNDVPAKAPAKAPIKAPAEAKVYKITVVDIVVDEEGNELGSETRFVDELEEGEEYSYSALDDESLTVVGEAEYTGICEGDLTIEFRYTSEDLGIELFANFQNYVYVTDEFYDTDDSLIASSSRKYGYNATYEIPSVNALKNSDYTVTAVIVKGAGDEYDVINGVGSPYSGTIYPYNQELGNLDVFSLDYAGIRVEEVVFKYAAKSEVSADTVSLTVVDEFYDQDGTTLVERREREVKEVAVNQKYSFSKLNDPGYNYYLMSDEVQTIDATEDKEVVFKYAKYINIGVRHIYKDADGNNTVGTDDTWSERFKHGEEYSIKSRPEYYGEAYEVEGDDTYTGTATSDLSLEFTYRKVDTATLDITYEYYDVEGGTLLYTSTDRVRVKKGSDFTPVDTLYYDSWEYRPISVGVSNVQTDMSVTCTYVKKKKYTVTGVFRYYDKDEVNLIREDRKPREFYEGSDVVVDWDGTERNYLLKTGDRNLTDLQADTEVELVFVEGQYTVTYHVTKLDVDDSVLSTYDVICYCMAGGSSVVPELPLEYDYSYEWTVEPQVIDNVQQDMEVNCECKRITRETFTISIIDRFLSADGKRVLFEYTRTEECAPGSSTHLKKPVKQGFVPKNITDYISEVNSDMTIVNESVASDKDCTVKLQFQYKGKIYEYPSLTVKPGTLISRQDNFIDLPGILPSGTDSAFNFVTYNEGDELPFVDTGYYYITDDTTICSVYSSGSGYDTYPLLVIDRYYNKSGDVVSEVARTFSSYRVGDSVTINAISGLSGYKPREASKTIIMDSSTDTLVLEYDECSTYTVTVKDKYYDTDGVTLLEENARPVEIYNAGENVTVNSKYNNLYACDETSKTVMDIQADTEIEFKYVKKAQYTVDITYIYYEADGVTEIERQTSQETVFAGDWCFFGGSKYGFYLGLEDNFIVPDKDTQIEVPYYKYSTVKVIFHVLDSDGNQIDEVQSDLGGLKSGLQTISATSPKYTSPSTCEKEVNVVNGMEVSFDVTAVPTQVTVTDYFGTIASYYPGADYYSGGEVPYINTQGIEDTANGNILSYGDYCFISTESVGTHIVEMNYGDSDDKLLGSYAGWKIVPQYQTNTGSSIAIRIAERTYMSASGYVFGYGYASESPSGNKCYYIKSSSVTVTADGKTYTADDQGKIVTPDDPADKEGYEFKGWSRTEGDTNPDNKLDFTSEVFDTDTEIYPIWIAVSSVVTVTADGKTYIADENGHITEPDVPAKKEGYGFKGWSRTEGDTNPDNKLDFTSEVFDTDTEIYPIWVSVSSVVTVTADGKTYTADDQGKITTPDSPASKDGYWFKGWSRTENDTNPDNALDFGNEVFDTDTEIYPIWVKKPVVTADGKTYIVNDSGKILTPTKPASKEGYIFAGWSLTEGDTDKNNKIDFWYKVFTSDTEIYPIWVQQFTITADGKTYKTDVNGYINTPDKPADKSGHIFLGWSRTESDTNSDNALNFRNEVFDADTEIYPIWVSEVKVKVIDCLMKATSRQNDCPHIADVYVVEERERTVETLSSGESKEYMAISIDGYKVMEDGLYWILNEEWDGLFEPNIKDNAKKTVAADDADSAVITIKFYYVDENVDYTIHDIFYTIDEDGNKVVQKDETRTGTYPFGEKLADNVKPLDDGDGNPPEGYYYFDGSVITDKPALNYDGNFTYLDKNARYKLTVKDYFGHIEQGTDGRITYIADGEITRQVDSYLPGEQYNYSAATYDGWNETTEGFYFNGDYIYHSDRSGSVYGSRTVRFFYVSDGSGKPVPGGDVKDKVTVTADGKTYTADDDGHIRTPDKPTSKPGYIFKGWSLTEGDTDPGNALDFSKQVFTTNTEVYPIWVKAAVVTADGKPYTADEDGHIKTPDYPADNPGYVFGGWSRTEGDTDPDNKLDFDKEVFDTDTEIYPIWVDANSVVKVTADGRTYAADSKGHITTPVDPAPRPGYIFAGWSRTEGDANPDNKLDFSSEVFDTDTEVYPIWVKEYTVTAGGKDYKTDIDGHIPTPDKPDDKPGYTFAGWSRTEGDPDDTNKIDFGSEVFTEDTEVYPIWVKGVTVTADGKSYTVDSDGHIRIPDNPAAKDGYIFAGWSRVEGDTNPDNKLDFISEVFVSDTEIFPIWVKEHTVTADGKDYKTDIDGHIPTPDKPADKDGYEFKGWSRTEGDTDPGNKIDFSKEVFTSDSEVYPIWVKVDSVVTVTADGKTYTADDNGHIRTPDAPASKPGYTFKGWSLIQGDTNPDNAIDFNTKVFTANTEIYPIWVAVHSGGSDSGSSSGGSGRSSSSGRSSHQELSGSWVHLEDGRWRFKLTDGSEIIGKWAYLKNPYAVTSLGQNEVDWFRFDDQGYMVTGWYTDVDGNIYYLHPVSDGSQGHMYTGWHWIEGTDGLLRCYYFNIESDGTKGALYRSKTAPDGSIVDENGAWVVGDGAVTREAVKTASEELTVAQNSTTRSILRSVSRMFGLA